MWLKIGIIVAVIAFVESLPTIDNADVPGRIQGEFLILLQEAPSERAEKENFVNKVVTKLRGILPRLKS